MDSIMIIAVCFLIYLIYRHNKKTGFHSKPTQDQKQLYISQVHTDKDAFVTKTYLDNKKKHKWLDPVMHEEIRNSLKSGNDVSGAFE